VYHSSNSLHILQKLDFMPQYKLFKRKLFIVAAELEVNDLIILVFFLQIEIFSLEVVP